MIIGERLRLIREEKDLSQGDIEERAGLLRCYVSRCENGHTVPSIETLEKWSQALGCLDGRAVCRRRSGSEASRA